MEIKEMNLADTEARMAELDSLVETSENPEEIEGYTEELRSLKEHKAELEALEERKANAKALEENRAEDTVKEIETRKEIETMKTIEEYRNSEEYINAFAEYCKTGDDSECRALLTTNVGAAGEVAIPDMVSNAINTDWLESEILADVRRISVKGNYEEQFELTAGDAVIHDEGSGAVSEEELTFGTVKLIPQSIKKWKSVSDEVLDLKGQEFLDYIVKELSYKISIKAEDVLIDQIIALPTSANENSVNAKVVKAGAVLGTIATALGELNAQARNPVVLMNPSTKAAFKAAVYSGSFNADPFEGLKVVLTNNLPAYNSASENDTYAIVGDFKFGALANFPNGETIKIKVDDKSSMKSDLVDILGREFVAFGIVNCRAFVKITKPASV